MILSIILLFTSIHAAQLPSYIKKCSLSDPNKDQCFVDQAMATFPKIINGSKEFHIPRLSPFYIKEISMEATKDLTLNFKNVNIYGFETAQLKNLKSDFDKRHVDTDIHFSKLKGTADYDINGKILIMAISGQGKATLETENIVFHLSFGWDSVPDKSGVGYAKIRDLELNFTEDKVYIHLDNLFNGDKKLGDEMNKFLNENYKEFLNEVRPAVIAAVKTIATSIYVAVLNSVPYDDLFLP